MSFSIRMAPYDLSPFSSFIGTDPIQSTFAILSFLIKIVLTIINPVKFTSVVLGSILDVVERHFWSIVGSIEVLGGCCGSGAIFDSLQLIAPYGVMVVTFSYFFLVSTVTFFFQWEYSPLHVLEKPGSRRAYICNFGNWYWRAPKISIFFYIYLSILNLASGLLNNLSFYLGCSSPYNTIFRSFQILLMMVVNMLKQGESYTFDQWASVSVVTVGIIVATVKWDSEKGLGSISLPAIPVLTASIFCLVILTNYLQRNKDVHDCNWREQTFYTHIFGTIILLAAFPYWKDSLFKYLEYEGTGKNELNKDASQIQYTLLNKKFIMLISYGLIQTICVCGISMVADVAENRLIVGLLTNVRKVISIVIYVYRTNSSLTTSEIIGGLCVFIGSYMFTKKSKKKNKHKKK